MSGGSRTYHTKSRNSCDQCRKRRVRCDLQAPTCAHCTRRQERCAFPDLEDYSPYQVIPGNWKAVLQKQDEPPPFINSDSELLSHYILVTASSLPLIDDFHPIWQHELPKLAIQHSFLLSSLLAISALHLGHLHPKQYPQYTTLARTHYLKATNQFRNQVIEVTEANFIAIFAFSITTAMFHFRITAVSTETMMLEDFLQPVLALRSAVQLIHNGLDDFFTQGPVARLKRELFEGRGDSDPVNSALMQHADDIGSTIPETSPLHKEVLYTLHQTLVVSGTSARDWDRIAQWPFSLPQEFLALVLSGDTVALALLGLWCRFVASAPSRWYWNGWAEKARTCIEEAR